MLAVTDPARGTDPNSPDVPWLLDRAATYLQTRGELRPARALFERAHRLYQDMFGKDHARTLASAGYLGNNLRALGGWCQTAHLHGKLATGSAKSQVRTLHFGHYR